MGAEVDTNCWEELSDVEKVSWDISDGQVLISELKRKRGRGDGQVRFFERIQKWELNTSYVTYEVNAMSTALKLKWSPHVIHLICNVRWISLPF